MELVGTDPDSVADMLVAWETELSKVMPTDFKDWWQIDRKEWPLVARLTIEGRRKSEELAWRMLPQLNPQESDGIHTCPHCGYGGSFQSYSMNEELHQCPSCKGTWWNEFSPTELHSIKKMTTQQ